MNIGLPATVWCAAALLTSAQAVTSTRERPLTVESGCGGPWTQDPALVRTVEADVFARSNCSLLATFDRPDLVAEGAIWTVSKRHYIKPPTVSSFEVLGPFEPTKLQEVPAKPGIIWEQVTELSLRDASGDVIAMFHPPHLPEEQQAGSRRQLLAQDHSVDWTFPSILNPADTTRYPNLDVAVGDTVTFTWPSDDTSPHGVYQIPNNVCPAGDVYSGAGFVQLAPIENSGSARWTASAPGTFYFACQESGHCDGGMIIAVVVGGSSTGAPELAPSQAPSGAAGVPTPAPGITAAATSPRAATTASSAGAGASHSSSSAQAPSPAGASGCGLSLAGQTQPFTSCQVLSTPAAQYNLLWTLQAPTAAGESVLSMAMDVPSSGGWVAVGFPSTTGEMVGASAVILKTDATSPTGASGNQYYLASQSTAGVQPPGKLNITDITAANSNGQLQGTWTLTLPSSQVEASTPLIFADGTLDSTGGLAYHGQSKSGGEVNFATGLAAQTSAGGSPHYNHLLWAHGWVAAIGLGFLIPLGIVLAKLFSRRGTWHMFFWLHIVVQGLGVLMGFVVAGLGAQLNVNSHKNHVHRSIGITVITAFGLQALLAIAWRPNPAHKSRWLFQLQHWYLGRSAACLAIANVYLGLNMVQPNSVRKYYIAYSVIIGVLFLAWLAKGVISWRHEPLLFPHPTKQSDQFMQKDVNGETGHANGASQGSYSGMQA